MFFLFPRIWDPNSDTFINVIFNFNKFRRGSTFHFFPVDFHASKNMQFDAFDRGGCVTNYNHFSCQIFASSENRRVSIELKQNVVNSIFGGNERSHFQGP